MLVEVGRRGQSPPEGTTVLDETNEPAQRASAVHLEVRHRGLVASLARPHAGNALDPDVLAGIRHAVDWVKGDTTLRCLVIMGTPGAFCAGADLAYTTALLDRGDTDAVVAFLLDVAATLQALEELPVPVIAAVDGVAMAGGFELVLACDMVLATTRARFADAHVAHGFIPGWHSTVRAPRKLGEALARRLLLSGQPVAPSELGSFITDTVAPNDLDAAVERWMHTFAGNGPNAMAVTKALLRSSLDHTAAHAAAAEGTALRRHIATDELAEGARAFIEHRRAEFPDRLKDESAG